MKAPHTDKLNLIEFVKSLASVRDLKVYAPGQAEKTPSSELSPSTRRLLIREQNRRVKLNN